MPLTDDEVIRNAFLGSDSALRDMAARLEKANEVVAALRGALNEADNHLKRGNIQQASDTILLALLDQYPI